MLFFSRFSCTRAPESKRGEKNVEIIPFSALDFGSQAALVHLFLLFEIEEHELFRQSRSVLSLFG